jgi:uncharacterized protein YbjT (DUF2867 family)
MTATPSAPLLVTGGTGTLGRAVVARLEDEGTDYRVLSRGSGPGHVVADLVTGSGVADALSGVTAVINCATSPRRDAVAAHHLLNAARQAGVQHLVHVSIVGIERIPLSYYREKLVVESLVASSGVPNTILRATQFHDLLAGMFRVLAHSPVLMLPGGTSFQPVDVRDVAARLVDLAEAGPAGRVDDFGGPEIRPVQELARSWLDLTSRSRLVLPVPLPGGLARAYRDGRHCTPGHADGRITFEDFVRDQIAAVTP